MAAQPPSSGPPRGAPPGAEPWTPHDFRQGAGDLASADLRLIEEAHQRFAAKAAAKLSVLLRQKVRLDAPRVVVSTRAAFLRRLRDPASVHAARSKGLAGRFLLVLTPRTLLAMIERLLGAPPETAAIPDRALTRLEASLARTVIRRLLEPLEASWRTGGALRLEPVIEEHSPSLEPGPPEAPVVRMTCAVVLEEREDARGVLELALQQGPLLSCLGGPPLGRSDGPASGEGRPEPGAPDDLRERILRRLTPVEVDVSADLTTKPLPLRELLALQPGDIIDTGVHTGEPVDLRVAGSRVGRAKPGDADGRMALRVK